MVYFVKNWKDGKKEGEEATYFYNNETLKNMLPPYQEVNYPSWAIDYTNGWCWRKEDVGDIPLNIEKQEAIKIYSYLFKDNK